MEDKAEQKLARFKELEEKIKKLENENKQLLYKVTSSVCSLDGISEVLLNLGEHQ